MTDLRKKLETLFPEDKAAAMLLKTPEEIIAFAAERGVDISDEEAAELLEQTVPNGELTPEQLEQATGGCGGEEPPEPGFETCATNKKPYQRCGSCEFLHVFYEPSVKFSSIDFFVECKKGFFQKTYKVSYYTEEPESDIELVRRNLRLHGY